MSRLRNIYEDDSDFNLSIFDQPRRRLVKIDPDDSRRFTLELYRGFDADLSKIQKDKNGLLIFSPKKSEQGLIWFTHQMISHHDPVEYAKAHGEWLLTYPLQCIRHFTRHWYDDGDYYDDIPESIKKLTLHTENCRYYMGIELPDGWVFSYKTQKFIGCSKELLVDMSMISSI